MTSSSKYTLLPSEPDDGGPINHEHLSETEANADKIDSSSNERRSRWRRVLALLFVFVFLLMSTGVLLFFIRRPSPERQEHDPTDHLENIAGDTRLERYQTPGNAETCPDWSVGQDDQSTVAFDLPPTTGLMFFVSRGQVAGGNFLLEHRKGPSLDTIGVTVTALFKDRKELEHAKACRASNPDQTENGLLLWADSKRVRFNITVSLPDIQRFGDLTTDLENFSHHLESFFDIWRPVTFGVVRLKSSKAPIRMEGLMGDSGFIQTSNAKLEGGFFGANKIQMQTSNAKLFAVVWALGPANGAQTDVMLRTSNGDAWVALAMATDFSNTKLKATVQTTNGGMNLTMARYMPNDGEVYLDLSTSNAPVNVFLHSQYEGTYDLWTSQADAVLQWDPDLRDPTGKGRRRTLQESRVGQRTRKEGRMFWGDKPSMDGSIKVRSSKEPVTLYSNPELIGKSMGLSDVFGQAAFGVAPTLPDTM